MKTEQEGFSDDYYKYYDERYCLVYGAGIKTWSGYAVEKELERFLKKTNPTKGSSTVDIGCGEARNSIFLANRGFVVTGVDFSKAALEKAAELAKEAGVNIGLIQDDALFLSKIEDSSFDFGISIGCLHMFIKQKHRDMFFKQIKRVMKPDSFFFLLNQGNGKIEERTKITDFLKVEKRRVAGEEERYVDLPLLACWRKRWDDHFIELKKHRFEIVDYFNSNNNEYGDCMCVILKIKNKF